jgi:MacB-like periplasmic core domain
MSDLRATLHQLRQSPAHIAACLLSLAVGMAICVAVFSVVNVMVFAPIPGVRDRQHLVQIHWSNINGQFTNAEFAAIDAAALTAFDSVAAEGNRVLALALPGGPASRPVVFASARYFETLGTRPIAGRLLRPDDSESGAPPVAVISEGLWRQAFSGDPAILGRPIGGDGVHRSAPNTRDWHSFGRRRHGHADSCARASAGARTCGSGRRDRCVGRDSNRVSAALRVLRHLACRPASAARDSRPTGHRGTGGQRRPRVSSGDRRSRRGASRRLARPAMATDLEV